MNAALPQIGGLLRSLYALGDGAQPETSGKVDDGVDEGAVLGIGWRAAQERPIDLENIHREPFQIGERRVAGPEVVDGQSDAQILDGVQTPARARVVFEQDALGDLQVQPGTLQAALLEGLSQREQEVSAAELARRDVYRYADLVVEGHLPVPATTAGLCEDPATDLVDQAGLLGQRDESVRRQGPVARPVPAQQRLAAE